MFNAYKFTFYYVFFNTAPISVSPPKLVAKFRFQFYNILLEEHIDTANINKDKCGR